MFTKATAVHSDALGLRLHSPLTHWLSQSIFRFCKPHHGGSYTGDHFFNLLNRSIFTVPFPYLAIFRHTNYYHYVTIIYSIQYSNMQHRLVAWEQQALPQRLGVQQARPRSFVSVHSTMFTQWQKLLTMHFSECVPAVRQHVTVHRWYRVMIASSLLTTGNY